MNLRQIAVAAIAATGACIWWSVAAKTAEPRVVVTLKPIHSLVAGIMQGVAEPELLIKDGGSPHAYALNPSQAKSLSEAGIVVRVSKELEIFLNDAIANLAPDATVITLDEAPGLTLHKTREGGLWEAHDHGGGNEDEPHGREEHARNDHGHEGHAHGEIDPHLWLDPENARKIAARVAAALSNAWPAHAQAFAANADRLSERLAALDRELKASTAPLKGRPYIVFHDAYRYFEARYGLRPAGSITVGPERAPGARRLLAIREWIGKAGAVCVFTEPQFEPRLVAALTGGTGARRGVLDPLGASLTAGPDQYFELIRNLAASLADCLEQ